MSTPLPTQKISIFRLVSVSEQVGLSLTLSKTLKTSFPVTKPI